MTALDLLIILQRFRTAALAYVPNSVLDPYLAEFDAACDHLKSRYQKQATKINLEDPSPCRDTIYMQGYDAEGKALTVGYRGSTQPSRDIDVMNAAIELYYAGAVRKQDNITPEVLWRHVMGSEWVPKYPTLVEPYIFQYDETVFVAFDPTDGGSSILGAWRTKEEAADAAEEAAR